MLSLVLFPFFLVQVIVGFPVSSMNNQTSFNHVKGLLNDPDFWRELEPKLYHNELSLVEEITLLTAIAQYNLEMRLNTIDYGRTFESSELKYFDQNGDLSVDPFNRSLYQPFSINYAGMFTETDFERDFTARKPKNLMIPIYERVLSGSRDILLGKDESWKRIFLKSFNQLSYDIALADTQEYSQNNSVKASPSYFAFRYEMTKRFRRRARHYDHAREKYLDQFPDKGVFDHHLDWYSRWAVKLIPRLLHHPNGSQFSPEEYDKAIPVGASKFGGYPDFPSWLNYDMIGRKHYDAMIKEYYREDGMKHKYFDFMDGTNYLLIAQINLTEMYSNGGLHRMGLKGKKGPFPKSGMLYFFHNRDREGLIENFDREEKRRREEDPFYWFIMRESRKYPYEDPSKVIYIPEHLLINMQRKPWWHDYPVLSENSFDPNETLDEVLKHFLIERSDTPFSHLTNPSMPMQFFDTVTTPKFSNTIRDEYIDDYQTRGNVAIESFFNDFKRFGLEEGKFYDTIAGQTAIGNFQIFGYYFTKASRSETCIFSYKMGWLCPDSEQGDNQQEYGEMRFLLLSYFCYNSPDQMDHRYLLQLDQCCFDHFLFENDQGVTHLHSGLAL